MIPKTAFVIFATLLVAIEAKSSQDLIGERLKGFHDHFTSQANVIKDAGINTDKIMNSLSASLKSLLQDAVKEMNDLEGKVTGTQEELNAERTKTETLQKENGGLKTENDQLKKEKEDLQTEIAECQGKTEKLTQVNKKLTEDNKNLARINGDLKRDLTKCEEEYEALKKLCYDSLKECQDNLKYLGDKLVKCNKDLDKCDKDLDKSNKDLDKSKKDLDNCRRAKTCPDLIAKNKDLTEKLVACETQQEKLEKEVQKLEKENQILQNEKDNCHVDLEVCRGGWEKVNGRYVKHFNDQKVTWSEAKASCEERNAKLLMVKDDVTQEWTKKIHTPVWIGATDQGHEGDWKWVDGSSVDKTKKSKHWGAGEPDSGLGLVEEDCLATGFELLWIHHGQWADEVCKSKFTFVCELPKV